MDALFSFDDLILSPVDTGAKALPENNASVLMQAIIQGAYPAIYAALRRYQYIFSPKAAFQLVAKALEHGLTAKAISALLARCPPLEEFLFAGELQDVALGFHGLVELAAYEDRADILTLLLDRGGNVNTHEGFCVSPLEAALEGLALHSVEVLANRPELDTTWTYRLLNLWSRTDPEPPKLEFCLQTLSPRFFPGEYLPLAPIPMPDDPQLLDQAAWNANWPLVERLCQERPSTPAEAVYAALSHCACPTNKDLEEQEACAAAMDALLSICPGLLRRETACRILLRCFLCFSPPCRPRLQPWVDRIRRRRVAMEWEDWTHWETGSLPDQWQRLFPQGPTLVVDRWSNFFAEPFPCGFIALNQPPPDSINLERILQCCPVRGRGRPGRLSPLAKAVLLRGSPRLIARLAQPGGLLAQEDPGALLAYTEDAQCPRASRAAVLTYIRKEETYDL